MIKKDMGVLDEKEYPVSINKKDIENLNKANCLIFGQNDKNTIFINFNKPTTAGEYQIISVSYEYAEDWDSFPEFLIAQDEANEAMVKWKEDEMSELEKDWKPSNRKKQDETVRKRFTSQLSKKIELVKPVLKFKWNQKSTDKESAEELIGFENKKEIVRILYGLFIYMPYSPTQEEIKEVYRIYRKYIPASLHVHMQNAGLYTLVEKETHAEDWDFVEEILEHSEDKMNWGLSVVDYAEKVEEGESWFNFRAVPENDEGKKRPAFLAIHLKLHKDPKLLLKIAQEVMDIIPCLSGHAGYDTFQSTINYKPTIDIEYQWAKRFAGVRIEEEDFLPLLFESIWPANWLTILGKPILDACVSSKYHWSSNLEKEKDISVYVGKYGTIVQAGAKPELGDVHKGQWPASYSKVQAAINSLSIHQKKVDEVSFKGKFDDENSTGAWFGRLTSPEKFYRLGEREAIHLPLKLAQKKSPKAEISEAIDDLKNYDGNGAENNIEIYNAANAVSEIYPDLGAKMYMQAIEWPKTFIGVYNNLLVYLLRNNDLKTAIQFLPSCLKAAEQGLKDGKKNAGGVFWIIACIDARSGKYVKVLEYIQKSKQTGYEQYQKLHRAEDFKELWGKKEYEELFI